MIRVLIVEDSAVSREYLAHLIEQDPALRVAGTAANGLEALAEVERLKPDVVLMDVYMPLMNGYEATRQIMERFPTPIVMASAGFSRFEMPLTFEALKAGALTVVEKPASPDRPGSEGAIRCLVDTVRLMAEVKMVRRWPARQGLGVGGQELGIRERTPTPRPRKVRIIAIGASTGGPQVILEMLGSLPRNLPTPILIVQHIAPGFSAGMVEWFDQQTALSVKLAEAGEPIQPGAVYLAPDGSQMGVTKAGRISLASEREENGFCPSADHLFLSVAEVYGRSAIGILLTGMGRDGAEGLLRLRQAGGMTIAQNAETSVVFGMPKAAIDLGAAKHVLSPAQISGVLRSLFAKEPEWNI